MTVAYAVCSVVLNSVYLVLIGIASADLGMCWASDNNNVPLFTAIADTPSNFQNWSLTLWNKSNYLPITAIIVSTTAIHIFLNLCIIFFEVL